MINGSIQPRDVMNYKKGVRFCVAFNNYNQPIQKGGYIFVRFLGYIARQERFCPIGTTSWHKLNKTYQADIIEMVRVSICLLVSIINCYFSHAYISFYIYEAYILNTCHLFSMFVLSMKYSPSLCIHLTRALTNGSLNMLLNISSNINIV